MAAVQPVRQAEMRIIWGSQLGSRRPTQWGWWNSSITAQKRIFEKNSLDWGEIDFHLYGDVESWPLGLRGWWCGRVAWEIWRKVKGHGFIRPKFLPQTWGRNLDGINDKIWTFGRVCTEIQKTEWNIDNKSTKNKGFVKYPYIHISPYPYLHGFLMNSYKSLRIKLRLRSPWRCT